MFTVESASLLPVLCSAFYDLVNAVLMYCMTFVDIFLVTPQACGLALLEDLMALFGFEPDPDVPSQPVMQQYQAQARACSGLLCVVDDIRHCVDCHVRIVVARRFQLLCVLIFMTTALLACVSARLRWFGA